VSPHRRETKPGVVGLDIGPSTIAAGQTDAFQPWKELRRIERAMDRSKRANPECFDDKGAGFVLRLSGAVRPGWLSRCDPSGSCLDRYAKRSCERQRTDLNLREDGALPFPTSLLALERVARITVLNARARPGML
jgi:hypothetical protein